MHVTLSVALVWLIIGTALCLLQALPGPTRLAAGEGKRLGRIGRVLLTIILGPPLALFALCFVILFWDLLAYGAWGEAEE